jgi:hypothetical protein
MFKFDAENLKDKEAEKIKKEINKLEIKQKLKEKRKLKEVNDLKGIDTNELKNEIQILDEKYKNMKKEVKKKLELNIETTDDFLKKGRLLNFYFKRKKDKNFPRFSVESEEELGAKEIIDFKPLRKDFVSFNALFFQANACLSFSLSSGVCHNAGTDGKIKAEPSPL